MCLQEMSKDYLSPADPVGEDLGLILERLHWASASHAPPPCVKGRVCSPSPAPSQDGRHPPPHSRDSDDDDSEACDEARACPVPGVT